MKEHGGSKGLALFFLYPHRWKVMGGQRHVSTVLTLGKTRYLF